MPRSRGSNGKGRKQSSTRKPSPDETRPGDKYLPKAAYILLRDFHQSVTAYPSEQQKKELASMIAKLPGAGACTVAKISTYFNERRKTVARASKPASELANAKPEVPTQALRIRIPPSRQRGPTSEPICPAAVKTDDLASRLRNALSQVSIPPTSPPKTFAELGRWCQETDASSEAFLRDISDRPGFTSASGCGATESARLR